MTAVDIAIRGGTIIDGTGSPRFRGDVGIAGGRIAEIGHVGDAVLDVDATDRIVAPGFVDVHTHYDAQVMWDPTLSPSPGHGVTTAVIGNCGFGIAPTRPAHRSLIIGTLERVEGMDANALTAGLDDWGFESFPEYLDAIQRAQPLINVAALVGHTPIRLYVMGADAMERAATEDEMAAMQSLVREAMVAGAIGIATSSAPNHVGYLGKPVPSLFATHEEFLRLADPLGELERGVMQITIGAGFNFSGMSEIAQRTGRPVCWAALVTAEDGSQRHRRNLDISHQMRDAGIPVYPQVSCRPVQFEVSFAQPYIFESMSLFRDVSSADHEGRRLIYADPTFRERFARAIREGHDGVFKPSWERAVVSVHAADPSLEERTVADIARERGDDPSNVALDLSLQTDLQTRFRFALLNVNETEVGHLLRDPIGVLGLSDAGAHASQLCDAGFSTHLLGHWVRELEVLTLEEAVRMLTSRPAEVYGLTDRGLLAPGRPADVVIFDPVSVQAGPLRRVADLPGGGERLVSDGMGIDAIFVNGKMIDASGASASRHGELLRGGHGGTGPR